MIDENRINQVFEAIIENGLEAFKDEDLVKLLEMLNKEELNKFNNEVYDVFKESTGNIEVARNASYRINSIIPVVKYVIDNKMFKIKKTNIVDIMNDALVKDKYQEFLTRCEVNELSDLKYYLNNNVNANDPVNLRATNKLINLIISPNI